MNKEDLLFPYEKIRSIQNAFMFEVKGAIENKKNLIVHAPTGLGKTISVIAPILPFAIKNNLTLFFLTCRHTQHKIAIDTLKEIKKKYNNKINVVDLVSKKHMCGIGGVELLSSGEFREYCKVVREKEECDFFSNLKEKGQLSVLSEAAINEIIKRSPLDVDEAKEISEAHNVCPYEISCLVGKKSNIIVGDYSHVLNPSIREILFKKMEKTLGKSIIVFDEAHNLPERARKLLDDSLSSYILNMAIKEAKDNEIAEDLVVIKNILEEFSFSRLKLNKHEVLIDKKDFLDKIDNYDELINNFSNFSEKIIEEKKRSFVKSVSDFLLNWKNDYEEFTRIFGREYMKNGKLNLVLSYKCLDPSLLMKEIVNESWSVIAMSGTLKPSEMYKTLLGFSNVVLREYKSPFPEENRVNIIVKGVTSKYTDRNDNMYEKIAVKCCDVVNNVPGNSVIFFPSYDMLEKVNKFFSYKCEKTTFNESSGLTKAEKDYMIEKFKKYKDKGAVLLAVSKASYGEGIDLPGDLLKCVVVVGIPLEKPSLETKELIDYYEKKFGNGWDYGYLMPGVIRTMQNAGRCIRSETDKGVIVFLDERYAWEKYFKCFPIDWNIKIVDDAKELVKNFFNP